MENKTIETNETTLQTEKHSATRTKLIIIGVAVIAIAFIFQSFLFSPERMAERMMERATGGEYDVEVGKAGTYTVTSQDGEESVSVTTGENTKIPDNWPTSVPVPNGVEIGYAAVIGGEAGEVVSTLNYTSKESAQDLSNYYKKELANNGWTIEAEMATGDAFMVSGEKGENETVSVYLVKEGTGTAATVSVQTKK